MSKATDDHNTLRLKDALETQRFRAEQAEAKIERLREALARIAKDAEESPMEDLLCAGEIARKALDD